MPCSDTLPTNDQPEIVYIPRRDPHHQTMTRLSCDRCREIETRGGTVPDWAQAWWKEHQRHDTERLHHDPQARVENAIRERAIAKLTPEERDELGV